MHNAYARSGHIITYQTRYIEWNLETNELNHWFFFNITYNPIVYGIYTLYILSYEAPCCGVIYGIEQKS